MLVLALIGVVAVIVVNKCGNNAEAAKGGGKGNGPAQAITVSGIVLHPQVVADDVQTTGSLLANNSVEIRNEVAGRLVRLAFEEGQHVEKGDLLVKIYDDDLQAQLRKLQLDEQLAATTGSRQKDLLDIKGISQQEYDASMNALNGIKADEDVVRAQIAKTEVRAPFSGVVGLRTVSEGAYLQAFTTIATLQQLEPMKLEFSVPERYRERLHVKDTVSFSVNADPDVHEAIVYAFEPAVDVQTRALKVRALCHNTHNALLPGAFAKVLVPMQRIEDALMVPSQAIIPDVRGQKVMVTRRGKAALLPVEVGLRNDSTVQVTKGLQVGDTVLTSGMMQLRPDMEVHVDIINDQEK